MGTRDRGQALLPAVAVLPRQTGDYQVFADLTAPLAVAVWDFSWLERRGPGGGYEDWAVALDELVERGYDCVRIDAYPHLIAADRSASWRLRPVWTQLDWGAPLPIEVRPERALYGFLRLCAARGVSVILSSWFREDFTDVRKWLTSPDLHADAWITTLHGIALRGLLDTVVAVDLCNGWAAPIWAPFLYRRFADRPKPLSRTDEEVRQWTNRALGLVRQEFPTLPLCMSVSDELTTWADQDVSAHDFLEPHIWMVTGSDFYDRLGFDLDACLFDPSQTVALRAAEQVYRAAEDHWRAHLAGQIADMARWSHATGKPLVTSQCWALVTWRDDPGLDWGWVKELCAFGVTEAARHGRWVGLATSNFCGPQFRGMWADVEWHRALTARIRSAPVPVAGC